MRCNISKCRQKIKLIKLINFELRCTSSFSLRRSEGEMPTSGTQGRADSSKQSDTRYKLEQSCICYFLSNLICTREPRSGKAGMEMKNNIRSKTMYIVHALYNVLLTRYVILYTRFSFLCCYVSKCRQVIKLIQTP